ncbi:MAG: NAD(P)/FAD-dependent oxidoreductase [Ilumatobacteraceae bacterium]
MRPRVVVIGGGIAGASAAWHLAESCDVSLVEQESQFGFHATGRSAATLSSTSGLPIVCALAEASRSFLTEPPSGFCDHPLLGPRGLLWIGRDNHDQLKLDSMSGLVTTGVAPTARRVDSDEARRIAPALVADAVSAGGFFEPDAKSIDVALLLQSYLASGRHRGVECYTSRRMLEALRLRHRSGLWRIDIDGFALEADFVVNAGGAWGDDVAVRAGVAPIGLQPFKRTAFISPTNFDTSSWPLVMDIGNRFYFEPEAGGLLISPSEETPSDPCDAQADELDIAIALDAVNGSLTTPIRSVRRSWAGLRTFAVDRVPVVGRDQANDTFIWLAGQGGAGIKIAPALGVIIASIVTGEHVDPLDVFGESVDSLSPARFGNFN